MDVQDDQEYVLPLLKRQAILKLITITNGKHIKLKYSKISKSSIDEKKPTYVFNITMLPQN